MNWKIVPDTSADLEPEFIENSNIKIEEVPLSIHSEEKEYIDNKDLDPISMLADLKKLSGPSSTSCPSPDSYYHSFQDADNIIVITMSHKLSGSYNSAQVAKKMILEEDSTKNIHIIDSLSTCGAEYLITEKAIQLIEEGLTFDEITKELDNYQKSLATLFTLSSFDNLIKNGRLSRFTGFFANKLNIRIIGMGNEGELKILHKTRGEANALAKLVNEMSKLKNLDGAKVIIAEVNNMPAAIATKHLIEKKYPEIESVKIIKAGGINSFYAEDQGLIVGF